MKKIIALLLGTSLLLGSAYVYFFKFDLFTELKDDKVAIELLEKAQPQDKVVGDSLVDGKTVYRGGPYRIGDTVFVQDKAVKIESIGFVENLKETGATHNQSHVVLKMTLYNYGEEEYTVSEDDLSIVYRDSKGLLHDQPLSISGYEGWENIKGSFILKDIPKKTRREGYIFLPAKKDVLTDGTVKVFVHNVPVEYRY